MTDRKIWTAGFVMLGCIAAVLIMAICSTSCSPYKAAWVTVRGVQIAAEGADKAIASIHRDKRLKCIQEGLATAKSTNGAKSASAVASECLLKSKQHDALKQWQLHAKPAIKAAIVLTAASLDVAQKAGDKKYDWKSSLLPAVCALARVVDQFNHLFPASEQSWVTSVTKLAMGFTCQK